MDSAERHELKENDLQGLLLSFRSFWDQHGIRIMLVVAVLSLLFAITSITTSRSRDRREQALTALASTSSPAAFREVALRYRNQPDVWAKAMLWGADSYLREATTVAEEPLTAAAGEEEPSVTPPARNEADRQLSLESAEAMYRELAHQTTAAPLFRTNALLGLGAVHESRTDWEEARKAYDQALRLAGTTYPALATQATQRLEMLPHLTQPLVFAPEPPAEETPAATALDNAAGQVDSAAAQQEVPAPATSEASKTLEPSQASEASEAAAPSQQAAQQNTSEAAVASPQNPAPPPTEETATTD